MKNAPIIKKLPKTQLELELEKKSGVVLADEVIVLSGKNLRLIDLHTRKKKAASN